MFPVESKNSFFFISAFRVPTNEQDYNVPIAIQLQQHCGDEIIRVNLFVTHVVSTLNCTA